MCGRLACSLRPQDICSSCSFKDPSSNQYVAAQWRDCYNLGKTYNPSFNVCPTEVAPVLVSGAHFQSTSRIVVPMIFGVIPHFGKTNSIKYSTINCRLETILSSKLYGNLLEKNQRCVVICNGFYEWQKQGKNKKPFFIHCEQPDEVLIDDPNTWNLGFTTDEGACGFRPLKLAALFETDYSESFEKATFSFTVITQEASSGMSWLHGRVPVVLETEERLDAWLNYEQVHVKQALNYISHESNFLYIPVSDSVSSSLNKDISCIKSAKEENNKSKKSSADILQNWLKKGQKRKSDEMLGDANVSTKRKPLT